MVRMGLGCILQNAEGTAGAETEAKEGVLRAGVRSHLLQWTSGQQPGVGKGRARPEGLAYRVPQGLRVSIITGDWDFTPQANAD